MHMYNVSEGMNSLFQEKLMANFFLIIKQVFVEQKNASGMPKHYLSKTFPLLMTFNLDTTMKHCLKLKIDLQSTRP